MNSVIRATRGFQSSKIEKIVVDDNSNCFSSNVKDFAQEANFKLIRNERNMGLANTRNYAVDNYVHGDHVVFLDADDLLGPEFLHSAHRYAHEYDIIYSDQILFSKDSTYKWTTRSDITMKDMAERGELPIPNVLKVDMFKRIPGFGAAMVYGHEDYVFWIGAIKHGMRLKKVNTIGSYYRIRTNSMARQDKYLKYGKAMVKLYHSDVYTNKVVCKALRTLQTDNLFETKLEAVLQSPYKSCASWIFMAIHKKKNGCFEEIQNFKNIAMKQCQEESEKYKGYNKQLKLMTYLTENNYYANCESDINNVKIPIISAKNSVYTWYTSNDELNIKIPSNKTETRGISKIIHFVYGLEVGAPFNILHYNAIMSAKMHYDDHKIMFHLSHFPAQNGYWKNVLQYIELHWVNPLSKFYRNRCFLHYAHRSDFIRIDVLNRYGGIYMDIDTITMNPIPQKLREESSFIIAKQDTPPGYGLCNAIMASSPNSYFSRMWIENYGYFRSLGMDSNWDEHSVRLPMKLSKYAKITILQSQYFFPFYWSNADKIVFGNNIFYSKFFESAYTVHLWTSGQTPEYSKQFEDLKDVCNSATTYGKIACKLQVELDSNR
jgi:hypothetical protein